LKAGEKSRRSQASESDYGGVWSFDPRGRPSAEAVLKDGKRGEEKGKHFSLTEKSPGGEKEKEN